MKRKAYSDRRKQKETWRRIQSDRDYPVGALGRPIDPSDAETLNAWREENLDRFMYP